MRQEERTILFDKQLGIEAYHFKGIMQKFPNHFHEYYVIGFVEQGKRRLSCMNHEYIVGAGDILLFNPLMNHTCEQLDDQPLDYRCLNITPERMKRIAQDLTGTAFLPQFAAPVAYRSELVSILRELHQMIMDGSTGFDKEERFCLLIGQLIGEFASPEQSPQTETAHEGIQAVCSYLKQHYMDHITLEELAVLSNMNKYALLRTFARAHGITPYRYLETVRVSHARKLLAQGAAPIDAALQTGFVDQSHFSNFFMRFIGLTPVQYRTIFIKAGPSNESIKPKED